MLFDVLLAACFIHAKPKAVGVVNDFQQIGTFESFGPRLAWNTGLRRGDIRTLHRHQITSAGLLVHVMSKTGVVVRRQLWPETLAAIEGIAGPDALIIPPCDWKKLNREIKAACKRAHVQVGTVKFARKGSASEVERSTPWQGYRCLGHTKPGVFDAYYRVDRICGHCVPQPPRPSSFK